MNKALQVRFMMIVLRFIQVFCQHLILDKDLWEDAKKLEFDLLRE